MAFQMAPAVPLLAVLLAPLPALPLASPLASPLPSLLLVAWFL
jgi:hypothetical protein